MPVADVTSALRPRTGRRSSVAVGVGGLLAVLALLAEAEQVLPVVQLGLAVAAVLSAALPLARGARREAAGLVVVAGVVLALGATV